MVLFNFDKKQVEVTNYFFGNCTCTFALDIAIWNVFLVNVTTINRQAKSIKQIIYVQVLFLRS